eukprot:m.306676 g.306676  ORF g.306676 m.306676 type:complete len:367 (+) comp41479_c0_seq1:260-1360(+)
MKASIVLLCLAATAVLQIQGKKCEKTGSVSHNFGLRFAVVKPRCSRLEKVHERIAEAYEKKCIGEICSKKTCCSVDDVRGNCKDGNQYEISFNTSISRCCNDKSVFKKVVKQIAKRVKKCGIKKLKLGKLLIRLQKPKVDPESPKLIEPANQKPSPPTMKLTTPQPTTLKPTTPRPTTLRPTTLQPTTLQPTTMPPPCFYTVTGANGKLPVENRKCCTTVCAEDPKHYVLITLSQLQSRDKCAGISISDGTCSAANLFYEKYTIPYFHASSSRCACICYPKTCFPSGADYQAQYSCYLPDIQKLVKFVLAMPEARELSKDEELFPKLSEALCDKSKAFGLLGEEKLQAIIGKVPPELAYLFLGKKK